MRKRLLACLAAILLFSPGTDGADRGERFEAPGEAVRAVLDSAVGAADPAEPCRLAGRLNPAELASAFYRGSAAERLAAIDAAGCESDPAGVLPYLAALLGARDRQVASASAEALWRLLDTRGAEMARSSERVSRQAAQLSKQLAAVARDGRIDTDLRGAALGAMLRLQALGYRVPWDPGALLEDPDGALRGAALALLSPPLGKGALEALAQMATGDPDRWLRGQSAALLCENALAHGAVAPSEDLARIVKRVVGDPETPAEPIGAILACVRHFPKAAGADIVDLALRHKDPSLSAFWKSLGADR